MPSCPPLNTSVNDFSDDLRLSLDDTVHTDTHDFVPECVADFWVRDLDQHELRDVADFRPTNEISTIDIFADGEVMLEVTKLEDKRMIFDAENMLISTFSNLIPCPAGNTRPSLKDLAEVAYAKTNYQIKKITKVYNPRIECMHNCFRTCYDIQDEKQVYHGTSFESASHIINSGFRGVGSRSKYGKGIYTSSSVWTSLLYANPSLTNEFEQTFLVANLLVGPSAVGKQGLVDFGCNEHGQRILTLTDSSKQIFCAAYDNQLAVTYQITVKYDFTKPRTYATIPKVMYLHPFIFKNLGVQLSEYQGFKVGDKVTMIDTFASYKFCLNVNGIIKKISKNAQQYVAFYIEPCDEALQKKVEAVNDKQVLESWENKKWLKCNFTQIKHTPHTFKNKLLFQDTKAWINAMRKSISDQSKFLRILDIDEKSLDTWLMNGNDMGDTTTKLRLRIKLHLDKKKALKASTAPQQPLTELGKRKFSNPFDSGFPPDMTG